MIAFSDDELIALANHIEKGRTCYVHKTTKEIIAIPNFVALNATEVPQAKLDYIKNHPNDFIYIDTLDTRGSFQILQDYIKILPDTLAFKEALIEATNNRKPFQGFKAIIENTEYKEHWFAFRESKIIEFIFENLKRYEKKLFL